jgi:hypothetical protein
MSTTLLGNTFKLLNSPLEGKMKNTTCVVENQF